MPPLAILRAALCIVALGLLSGRAGTAHAAPAADARVARADHVGTWTGTSLEWQSRIELRPDVEPGTVLPFVVPLQSDTQLRGLDNATPVEQAGQLVGLLVVDPERPVRVDLSQPMAEAGGDRLDPPLVAGIAVQRLGLDGLDYDPAASVGLEQRLRHLVVPELRPGPRRQLDRALDGRKHPLGPKIYVVADDRIARAGGLVGDVHPAGRLSAAVVFSVGGIFLLVIIGGVVGFRMLEVQARRERLERYMADEFVGPPRRTPPLVPRPPAGVSGSDPPAAEVP